MGRGTQQKRRAAARAGTRAQRRAEEREAAKRAPQSRGLPMSQVVGGLITLVVVLGIIIWAVMQSQAHNTTTKAVGKPLTTPTALNPKGSQIAVGKQAPDFTLADINGQTHNLAAQRGHPVLLEFYAVWCPHCQHMAPVLENLQTKYAKKGVRMWMILANPYGRNYDASYGQDRTPATKHDVVAFQNLYGETLPKLVDPNFHVVNEYGVSAYPGLYVIDKHGKIVYSASGEKPAATLESAINKALSGKT